MPLMKSTPWMTSARCAKPRSLFQLFPAHWLSLNIMWSIPSRPRQPFARLVRCRMVANALLIGFDVRMFCQCCAGKSWKVCQWVRDDVLTRKIDDCSVVHGGASSLAGGLSSSNKPTGCIAVIQVARTPDSIIDPISFMAAFN